MTDVAAVAKEASKTIAGELGRLTGRFHAAPEAAAYALAVSCEGHAHLNASRLTPAGANKVAAQLRLAAHLYEHYASVSTDLT